MSSDVSNSSQTRSFTVRSFASAVNFAFRFWERGSRQATRKHKGKMSRRSNKSGLRLKRSQTNNSKGGWNEVIPAASAVLSIQRAMRVRQTCTIGCLGLSSRDFLDCMNVDMEESRRA